MFQPRIFVLLRRCLFDTEDEVILGIDLFQYIFDFWAHAKLWRMVHVVVLLSRVPDKWTLQHKKTQNSYVL